MLFSIKKNSPFDCYFKEHSPSTLVFSNIFQKFLDHTETSEKAKIILLDMQVIKAHWDDTRDQT